MSRFSDTMYDNAHMSTRGMVTGEPHNPVRHTWSQVHQRARRVAGGLRTAGIGHGDAVAVLAGAPVEIAPTAQGVWMRDASLTMLHQPTLRTDLALWATETRMVIGAIGGQGGRHFRTVHGSRPGARPTAYTSSPSSNCWRATRSTPWTPARTIVRSCN